MSASAAVRAARDIDGLRAELAAAPEAGRLQPLGLGRVLLGAGVLAELPALVAALRRGDGRVALVADGTPMGSGASGGELKATVAEALGTVRRVTLGDAHGRTHADAATVAAATDGARGAALVVSVGSGTVADVGKAAAAALGLPHVVVQTAASVNGFADDQSVLLVDGVKRTTPTAWPDALLIDTGVLAAAPAALNRAGLGDLLASFTAPADWRLAKAVGQDDSYSPAAVALARRHAADLLAQAGGIPAGDPAALDELAAGLVLSGVSMGVAGRTAPGSGMEHTVSHLLEMAPGPSALHGAQVGVLSVLGALLWERVRAHVAAEGLGGLRYPAAEEMRPRVLAAFERVDPSGAAGAECWRDYARKLERWHAARPDRHERLAGEWPALDAELGALLAAPAELLAALRAAGAPTRLGELGYEAGHARWALANCHLMRDRFTVADLAFLLGCWEPSDVDALLADAAALGAGL